MINLFIPVELRLHTSTCKEFCGNFTHVVGKDEDKDSCLFEAFVLEADYFVDD
jgi:hypothetical protein